MIINGDSAPLAAVVGRLRSLGERLSDNALFNTSLVDVVRELHELEAVALALHRPDVVETIERAALLLGISADLVEDNAAEASAIIAVVKQGLFFVENTLHSDQGDPAWLIKESSRRFGGLIRLVEEEPEDVEQDADLDENEPAIQADQLIRLLAPAVRPRARPDALLEEDYSPGEGAVSLSQFFRLLDKSSSTDESRVANPAPRPIKLAVVATLEAPSAESTPVLALDRPVSGQASPEAAVFLDPETREAFRTDAEELLERMSPLVQLVERNEQTGETFREIGRGLHTLKGASGAVGLAELHGFVHALEDQNEAALDSGGQVPPGYLDLMHELVLRVESILSLFASPAAGEPGAVTDTSPAGSPPPGSSSGSDPSGSPRGGSLVAGESDETVRVPVARLGELMDLVAELFFQNGPRSALAAKAKEIAAAARASRNRLIGSVDRLCDLKPAPAALSSRPGRLDFTSAIDPPREHLSLIRSITEQSDDLMVLAESARSLASPMIEDADVTDRLTRQLWDLLHEIRVVPVRPLLQRLARVARAAARIEAKQVEVTLIGEDVDLDRLVQDKLFEPLLHIVRNAVGHGIEPADARLETGKGLCGRLTLEASRDEKTFVFTVSDDGRGLNYTRIEAKARRLNLIQDGETVELSWLQSLLFRPGFTTRDGADALSGRGVGMDVVAQEIARLQGTITIDSTPGRGTTFTLVLPAKLSLEQSMVVRIEGQLFGLPLQSVETEEASDTRPGSPILARAVLGLSPAPPSSVSASLGVRVNGVMRQVVFDEITGSRELVVRPAHPLLSGHPIVSGTSLTPGGELVLMLNPAGFGLDDPTAPIPLVAEPDPVLLVDDSISVRRTVSMHLVNLGLEVEVACDGLEALGKLRLRRYRLIITDLDMPRMDGFQLLASLAREPVGSPRVVVSSSRNDPETRRRVRELGADGFLPKPARLEDLASVIGPLLGTVTG